VRAPRAVVPPRPCGCWAAAIHARFYLLPATQQPDPCFVRRAVVGFRAPYFYVSNELGQAIASLGFL
jgi:hypothetical protein